VKPPLTINIHFKKMKDKKVKQVLPMTSGRREGIRKG
jgi:hypothetical protein